MNESEYDYYEYQIDALDYEHQCLEQIDDAGETEND